MHTAARPMQHHHRRRKIPLLVRIVIAVAATLGVLVVGLVIYVAHAERSADRKAIAFCLAVKVGAAPAGLLERGRAEGASVKQSHWTQLETGEQELDVVFEGATPLSRHVCAVQVKDAVTRADYRYVD